MSEPDDLLNEWGRQVLPVEDAAIAEERRARLVSRIAGTIRETATDRSRSNRRARLGLALVAAVLLLVTGVFAFATRERAAVTGAMVQVGPIGMSEAAARAQSKPAATAPPAQAPAPEVEDEPVARAPLKAQRSEATTVSATDLAEQNRLFASARAATQRGDDKTALANLDKLLSRWPKSPLAPEARVERFRALKRLGDSNGAAREARRYLLDQNDGPAREEARDLALDPNQSLH